MHHLNAFDECTEWITVNLISPPHVHIYAANDKHDDRQHCQQTLQGIIILLHVLNPFL